MENCTKDKIELQHIQLIAETLSKKQKKPLMIQNNGILRTRQIRLVNISYLDIYLRSIPS